jgi:hypothetical protein
VEEGHRALTNEYSCAHGAQIKRLEIELHTYLCSLVIVIHVFGEQTINHNKSGCSTAFIVKIYKSMYIVHYNVHVHLRQGYQVHNTAANLYFFLMLVAVSLKVHKRENFLGFNI